MLSKNTNYMKPEAYRVIIHCHGYHCVKLVGYRMQTYFVYNVICENQWCISKKKDFFTFLQNLLTIYSSDSYLKFLIKRQKKTKIWRKQCKWALEYILGYISLTCMRWIQAFKHLSKNQMLTVARCDSYHVFFLNRHKNANCLKSSI
jgi:hypothetical protein